MSVKLTWVFKEVEIEYNTEFMAAQFDMHTQEDLVTYRCFDEQCGFEDDLHNCTKVLLRNLFKRIPMLIQLYMCMVMVQRLKLRVEAAQGVETMTD